MKAVDFSYTYEGKTLYYTLVSDSTCVVEGNWNSSGDIIIPSKAVNNDKEYSVIAIADRAFHLCDNLNSITIPNTVTRIGYGAFSGSSLRSVIIPNSVTVIEDNAFYFSYLESMTIPNSVKTIGDNAFAGTFITSVVIPDAVTSIGNTPFYDCGYLTSITVESQNPNYSSIDGVLFNKEQSRLIQFPGGKSVMIELPDSVSYTYYVPNTVTKIADKAFYGCTNPFCVTIPNTVSEIGEMAFARCSELISIDVFNGNENYASEGGVLFNKDLSKLIQWPGGKYCDVIYIPDYVTEIGRNSFDGYYYRSSVVMSNSVTTIGTAAFSGCNGLERIVIGESVTSIGDYAFYDCSGLESLVIPGSVTEIGEEAFEYCQGLETVKIMDIEKWCKINFAGLYANPIGFAKSFTIGDSDEPVKDLELDLKDGAVSAYAFYGAQNLESLRVKSIGIGDGAFMDCYKLKTARVIGDKIGNSAFSYCNNLTQLCIDVDELSENSFSGNDNLEAVYCMREVPPTAFDNSFSKYDGVKLYVPEGSVSRYATAEKCWYRFLDDYESNFSDLDEIFGSGSMTEIKNVVADGTDYSDASVEVYNLNGVKVGDSTDGLQGGLYIVRQGNDVKKIAVK